MSARVHSQQGYGHYREGIFRVTLYPPKLSAIVFEECQSLTYVDIGVTLEFVDVNGRINITSLPWRIEELV